MGRETGQAFIYDIHSSQERRVSAVRGLFWRICGMQCLGQIQPEKVTITPCIRNSTASNPRPHRVILGAAVVECSKAGVLAAHPEEHPSVEDLVQPFRLMLAWAQEVKPRVDPQARL